MRNAYLTRAMSLGAIAATILIGAAALTATPGPEKVGIRFGACDWTLGKSGDPAALELAASIGLDGVQVSLVPKGDSLVLSDAAARLAYATAMEKSGAAIASFAIGDLNDVPLKSDPRAEKWLSEGIDVAREMKVGIILVPFFGPGDIKDDPAGEKAVIAALKRLAPKAEKSGVILAVESYLSAEGHRRIIDAVGSPAVRVYYDTANSQGAGYDILREIRGLGSLISEIHAKDDKDIYGKGSIDFKAVRKAMADIGYSGWFVLEGSKYPLGREKSIAYDLEYLRGVFSAPVRRP
jgi:L-ribulose-5-phosphate 3-epimerase